MHDNKTLSKYELFTLKEICNSYNPELQNDVIPINTLEIVLYCCRSLEKRLFTESIPLLNPVDTSLPPPDHLEDVSGIMKQFSKEKLSDYLPFIQKPGHRESYYQEPCIKATLIYDLKKIPTVISQFKDDIDKRLPGMYRWFSNNSLHITIRSIE